MCIVFFLVSGMPNLQQNREEHIKKQAKSCKSRFCETSHSEAECPGSEMKRIDLVKLFDFLYSLVQSLEV